MIFFVLGLLIFLVGIGSFVLYARNTKSTYSIFGGVFTTFGFLVMLVLCIIHIIQNSSSHQNRVEIWYNETINEIRTDYTVLVTNKETAEDYEVAVMMYNEKVKEFKYQIRKCKEYRKSKLIVSFFVSYVWDRLDDDAVHYITWADPVYVNMN